MSSTLKPRAGQIEFERGVDRHRLCALVARRQYGKTTICARIALKKMMRTPGHTVIFGSVKVELGKEMIRKEADELRRAIANLTVPTANLLDVVDDQGRSTKSLAADDFAELYQTTRLELRLYHSRTVYSRTKIVALTPDAVGETGDLILDEVGRAKRFPEVCEAMFPIISSNPNFRCLFATTFSPDDSHYSNDLLAYPVIADFPVNPKGNWYETELHVHVLRVSAYDAYADGVPLYDDDTGAPITPQQSRAAAQDKDAWDRNYGCIRTLGGTSACGSTQLDTAQRRGIGQCAFFQIQSDGDFDRALPNLTRLVTGGRLGLGWDLATTTNETSNPSSFSVIEEHGVELILRAIFIWKTAEYRVQLERARRIIETLRARKAGPPRALAIDATNERYFAAMAADELGTLLPVQLVVGSETVQVPGRDEKITTKQQTCGALVAELDDNHLWLPPEKYIRQDWRLVKKEKGQYVCIPDQDGRHGDTFDGARFALRALRNNAGAITSLAGITVGLAQTTRQQSTYRPRLRLPLKK